MSEQVVNPEESNPYTKMAGRIYDLIYSNKDYQGETEKVAAIIQEQCLSGGNEMLDVACGTGSHMQYFRNHFEVDGIDLSLQQVECAIKKFPGARIEQGDMLNFEMNKKYDAIICLFSSIGYVETTQNLSTSMKNIVRHLKPGGVVIIEPWLSPEVFEPGRISMETNDHYPNLKVARMMKRSVEGNTSVHDAHIMVANENGIYHFQEEHRLGMFEDDDFRVAFNNAGLQLKIDPEGLTGRRLMIGTLPK